MISIISINNTVVGSLPGLAIFNIYNKLNKKKINNRIGMLARVYTDLDEANEYYNSDNLEYDYQITSDHRVVSENIILLSALCIHLFGEVSRQKKHYNQIQNGALTVGQNNRKKSIQFMSEACSKFLDWIKYDFEAELLIDFLNQQRNVSDGLIILKLANDSDLDTTNPVVTNHYVIVYFFNQEVSACLDNFAIQKTPLTDLAYKRKLQFLHLIDPSQIENSMESQAHDSCGYGFKKQGEVSCKLVQYIEEPNSVRNSVYTESSNLSGILIKFEYFVYYGTKSGVKRFKLRLEEQLNQIKCQVYNRGDEIFNNPMFTRRRKLAEQYRLCQVYSVNNGDFMQVYYHSSVEQIFNGQFLKQKNYRKIHINSVVRAALKQPIMISIQQNSSDMIIYEDNEEGDMLMATKQIIQLLESCKINIKSQTGSANKKQDSQQLVPKAKVDFTSNIGVNEANIGRIFEMTDTFKIQEQMNFKIDVGEHICIINRVKKCDKVYLVFQNFAEIMRLQAIMEDPIDHKQIQRVIQQYEVQIYHQPKEILTKNSATKIGLYPCTEELEQNKQKYFERIIEELRQESSFFIKTIVCSYQTLKNLLSVITFNFHINFAINQPCPQIQCDSIFNKQTHAARVKTNKVQHQYYSQVRTDIMNKDYREPSKLRKEEANLKKIMERNIHQYEIGEFVINEVDQYNISYMIAEKLERMYFILSKRPTQEYIYLTYHQKILKVIRDKNGNFARLEDAFMKVLNRQDEAVIRIAICRAFLTGQKYVAINLPIQHVKLMKLADITRLSYGNHNLVRYYLGKMQESERYKLQIKPPCTTEYFQKVFAKQYVLRFDDKKIRSQIKQLDLGYGNIEKWREQPFVCMKADHYICQNFLKKCLLEYEPQQISKK